MWKIPIVILLILVYSSGFAQENIFYYSGGEKRFLQQDSTSAIMLMKNIDETRYKENTLKIKTRFSSTNEKIFDSDGEDNAIMIESVQLKSMDIRNLGINTQIDTSEIDFITYGKINANGKRIWATNEVLLKLKRNKSLGAISAIIKKHKGEFLEQDKWGVITLICSTEANTFSLANELYESGKVKYALPNFYMNFKTTSDPIYNDQYYLHNTGQTIDGTEGENDIDIDAAEAWKITKGAATIKVAVIDDGVEAHEDLFDANGVNRVLEGFSPACLTNCDGRPKGSNAHGQACAGIIAASHNNLGVKGIAPNVKIIPVRIFNRLGLSFSDKNLAKAINKAWDELGADVLSNSWGSECGTYDDVIADAIENAIKHGRGGKGSVVVFSSGNGRDWLLNEGKSNCVSFPANLDNVLAVGSIDKFGDIFYYSQGGQELDVVAPSGDINGNGNIRTIDRGGNKGYTSGDYTNSFGGTSAACPQVAGVAALILSINPNLTEEEVRCRITSTAKDIGEPGRDDTYGYGLLNANAAVSFQELTLDEEVFSGTQKLESNKIIASNTILKSGSNIIFQAKEMITLKEGFYAEPGSKLLAFTDSYFSCNFGIYEGAESRIAEINQVDSTDLLINNYHTKYSGVEKEIEGYDLTIYPNPFENSTTIEYYLPTMQQVTIIFSDIMGKELMRLQSRESHEKGQYTIQLGAGNYPSGIYIVTFLTDDKKISKRIVKK